MVTKVLIMLLTKNLDRKQQKLGFVRVEPNTLPVNVCSIPNSTQFLELISSVPMFMALIEEELERFMKKDNATRARP